MERSPESTSLREAVHSRYAAAASAVTNANPTIADSALPVLQTDGCCGATTDSAGCCGPTSSSVITQNLYAIDEVAELPSTAVLASLGCGNPTALAELKSGETVLDLGSGGGIDAYSATARPG